MSDKVLYSYTGLFNTPDEIIKAAKAVAGKGYKKFDVNTPYPVHGMDGAMKLKRSPMGYIALVLGVIGALAGLTMMYFMSVIDYPHVIGGKPFFPLPAYVPIMFETTVLVASVGTVLSMLFAFFKFPNNMHPLHDTEYMQSVSVDKYGIYIEAEDDKFSEEEVKSFLKELGAYKVEPVYFDEKEYGHKNVILEPKFIGFLVVVFFLVSGALYFTMNKALEMPPFTWMQWQDKVIPQEKNNVFADNYGMRNPVKGTVARGAVPYLVTDENVDLANDIVNPLLPSKENIELGKKKYNTFCSPCHGYLGEGESRLRGQFPKPPSLHSEKVRGWTDGRINHVIMKGQNTMPSYSSLITRQERWATVLYIRALQRSLNARESDLQ